MVDMSNPRQPLPAFIVARKLGVSRQLLHSWVRSGKLHPADWGRDGRPLYRPLDAAHIEQQTRRSPNSRRGSRHHTTPAA